MTTRKLLVSALLALAAALATAAPAAARTAEGPTAETPAAAAARAQSDEPEDAGLGAGPAAPPWVWRLGLRLGAFDMINSSDSYDAVYGDPVPLLGVAIETEIRRRWLIGLTWDFGEVDGEQVLPSRPPRPTGVGTTLSYRPLSLTGAYVLNPAAGWRWHLGAGVTRLDWSDEGITRRNDGSDVGYHAVAGLRHSHRSWTFGGELRYSTIPDAVGDGGIAGFFGEDDLGGVALHLVALYRLR